MSQPYVTIAVDTPSGRAIVKFSREDEMEAFDMLGPLLRKTMTELPLGVMAFPLIQECLRLNLDPNDPAVDAMLSNNLKALVARGLIEKDKIPVQDVVLGMKPMRARRRQRAVGCHGLRVDHK